MASQNRHELHEINLAGVFRILGKPTAWGFREPQDSWQDCPQCSMAPCCKHLLTTSSFEPFETLITSGSLCKPLPQVLQHLSLLPARLECNTQTPSTPHICSGHRLWRCVPDSSTPHGAAVAEKQHGRSRVGPSCAWSLGLRAQRSRARHL